MQNEFAKTMRWTGCLSLCGLLCLMLLSPTTTSAQRKKTSGTSKRPVATPTPAPTPMNLTAEAGLVAEQIRLVARFLYVYGKVANGLELAEEQARRGEASSTAKAQTQRSKDAVVNNISNLRAGLGNVLTRLQGNPRLQVQYLKMSSAVDAATDAERFAASNRFDEAGKSLILTIERLTDVMQALR